MTLDLEAQWRDSLAQLRTAPTAKRLRAHLDGEVVLDTRDALLVWEPRRVVPQYAVPPGDLRLELTEPAGPPGPAVPDPLPALLPPGHFGWHTTAGAPLTATVDGRDLGEVAFRPDDPGLDGRVVVDFDPFEWVEEDQPVLGHPHDPFKRIDILRSDRHVRVELGGVVLAESDRPVALFETLGPVRWYLPREDVRMDLLSDSDTHTTCAYKGVASYLSLTDDPVGGPSGRDIAWFYPDPLHEAEPVQGLIAFWSERADVLVDGRRQRGALPGHDEARRS